MGTAGVKNPANMWKGRRGGEMSEKRLTRWDQRERLRNRALERKRKGEEEVEECKRMGTVRKE